MAGGTRYLDALQSAAGTALAIVAANSSTWRMLGDSAGDLNLTIVSENATGNGVLAISADNEVQLGDGKSPTLTLHGTGNIVIPLARQVNLVDDSVQALQIGSSGLLDMLKLVTSNGIEAVVATNRLRTTQCVASGESLRCGGRAADASAGVAVTNTADETVSKAVTIPGETLVRGRTCRVLFGVRATATHLLDTLTVRLRLGGLAGTVLIATSAVDVADNDVVVGEFEFTAEASPAAGVNVTGDGMFSQPAAAGGAMISAYLVPTPRDTQTPLGLAVTMQWSVADPGNSAICEYLRVEYV